MKISLYVRIHIKTILWKFCGLNPKNSRVIYPRSLNFSEKVGYFLTYSIVSACLQTNISYISGAHNSKSKWCYNVKPSAYYFYVKTKVPVDFQICIGAPLMKKTSFWKLRVFNFFSFSKKTWLWKLQGNIEFSHPLLEDIYTTIALKKIQEYETKSFVKCGCFCLD